MNTVTEKTDVILKIEDVNRTYTDDAGNTTEALRDVNLDVKRGEFVSFIGASGCGKTTLLRLVAGLDMPESGSLTVMDSVTDGPVTGSSRINGPDPKRGYVFQQGSLFPWLNVRDNISFGLKARGVHKTEKDEIAKHIEMVGLSGFEKSFPHQISGGMAQRVAIARALINGPTLLLLDEPMGALDNFTRADIQDKLIEIWQRSGTTMLLVTHDVDEAIYMSDRIVIMTPRPGQISEIIEVRMPHPRHRGGTEFLQARREILSKLHLASAEPPPEYQI